MEWPNAQPSTFNNPMTIDTTKPADHAPVVSAELRDQFNALQGQITTLQQLFANLVPALTFDSAASLWNVTYAGPSPANWQVWRRCNYAPDWAAQGTLEPASLPASSDSVLAMDETWWQIKFLGLDADAHPITPFSNVVSGGPVP